VELYQAETSIERLETSVITEGDIAANYLGDEIEKCSKRLNAKDDIHNCDRWNLYVEDNFECLVRDADNADKVKLNKAPSTGEASKPSDMRTSTSNLNKIIKPDFDTIVKKSS
jgi:hypothetical protein